MRAFEPLADSDGAAEWLEAASTSGERADDLIADGIAILNRALRASAAAIGDPYIREVGAKSATVARIGYGNGNEVAEGRFTDAREIDVSGGRRQSRADDLHPQERIAAVIGGREQIDACELPLLRARTDLDVGAIRTAALQVRIGLEALLAELEGAVSDPGHLEDMAVLEERRREAGEAANAALRGDLPPERAESVRELLEICERVLRRRRVLGG